MGAKVRMVGKNWGSEWDWIPRDGVRTRVRVIGEEWVVLMGWGTMVR